MMTNRLIKEFDFLVEAPNGIRELRKAILQLAVEGRLVPQDPKEEPASVLLRQMGTQPRGSLKKRKTPDNENVGLPSVTENSPHSELPLGWTWARPVDLGEICGGGTPSKNRSQYWDGNIPWVSPKDMGPTQITSTEMHVTERALAETTVRLIPSGSILIVARSGILKRMLPVAINRMDCVVNQDMKVIIPFVPDTADYIRLMLKGHEAFILRQLVKQGMTVQSLKYSEFEIQPFPLPPLAEQKRIVAKVDQLVSLCDELEAKLTQARQDADTIATSIVYHICGQNRQGVVEVAV